jgi:hypothetical protein
MTVSVADLIEVYGAADVNCGGGSTSLTVAAGSCGTCSYESGLEETQGAFGDTNTATVTLTTPATGAEFSADAVVDFSTAIVTSTGFPVITVYDTLTDETFGPFDEDTTFTFEQRFSCQAGEGVDQVCADDVCTFNNFVYIVETGKSATAAVDVTCVVASPTLTKDAFPSFTRTYEWNITKTGSTELIEDLPVGETTTVDYTVTVTMTGYTDSDWAVEGSINIYNPPIREAIIQESDTH